MAARAVPSRSDGWFPTKFRGRFAWRHSGDFVAFLAEGQWQLWRDGAEGAHHFATYPTPREMTRDLERSSRVSREPRLMHGERRPRPPRESAAEGGWRHDDPRWG